MEQAFPSRPFEHDQHTTLNAGCLAFTTKCMVFHFFHFCFFVVNGPIFLFPSFSIGAGGAEIILRRQTARGDYPIYAWGSWYIIFQGGGVGVVVVGVEHFLFVCVALN